MREIKALFLVLLSSLPLINLCCPVFADNEIVEDKSGIQLIPLDASYDTNYKIGSESICKAETNTQFMFNTVNMRKIIPIVFESSINSKYVCIGDPVTARLKEDLYYGRQLIAPKNSLIKGSVVSYRSARTLSDAVLHKEDCLQSNSAVGIRFNELVINKNNSISLIGQPVHQESLWLGADGYTYGISVDHQGRVVEGGRTLTKEQTDSYNVLRVATNAPLPGSLLLNIVAGPAVMGAVGAASPDLAFSKPLDRDVKHKRLKGMAYGFVTNLPGAFFIQSIVQKGNDVVLSAGDQLLIDLTINSLNTPRLASTYQPASIDGTAVRSEILAVKGLVLEPKPSRLLPAAPCTDNSSELALKPFIPSSD